MRNDRVESKSAIVEMHPDEYRDVEVAAQKLGRTAPELLLLSASLFVAVVNGGDVMQALLESRRNEDFAPRR